MAPKLKQAKKGPTFKAAFPLKDIVPVDIKQPPRESRPVKVPEVAAEAVKNPQHLPSYFEEWPSEEGVKAHDFGIASEHKFNDPYHEKLLAYLHSESIASWEHATKIQERRAEFESQLNHQSEHRTDRIQEKSSHKVGFSYKNIETGDKKPPIVIDTYLRLQTEEEMHARLKMEQQKAQKAAKDKKKGKKEEPKQDGPQQVSDVKMNDVCVAEYMCKQAIWIGSQLQIIKQRGLTDVYTGEPIWKKIFPQENGVPQLTKSGKYWVKLYFMGRPIKIEIDDRIPVDENFHEKFPTSSQSHQKWTLIICKALVKYLSKINPEEPAIGNGLVTYALTGMLSENFSLAGFKDWQQIEQHLSDEHYLRKDVFVSCYSQAKFNYPTHYAKTQAEFESKTIERIPHSSDMIENADEENDERDSLQEENEMHEEGIEGESAQELGHVQVQTHVLEGYSYCICDFFKNDTFNMIFSQEKSQKEIQLRNEYNQLCKVSLSNKGREEKLQYRRKKKELKEKLVVQEKKRLQMIGKPPLKYHFMKLLDPDLKTHCEYNEKQILLAKKCVANNLSQPPNYDTPTEKDEKQSKSMQSFSVIKLGSDIKDGKEEETSNDLEDFSSLPNVFELLPRNDHGQWITDVELVDKFNYMQILYNPNVLKHKIIEEINSVRQNVFTHDEKKEILVVQRQQNHPQTNKSSLLFGFGYQKSPYDTPHGVYSKLEKFDFGSFQTTSTVVTLNSSFSCKQILFNNINNVFKLYTLSKGNYSYWIASNSPCKLISIADYLIEYEGYTQKVLTTEYLPIESNCYCPLAKFRIKQKEAEENVILVKLVNAKEQLMQHLTYKLIANPKDKSPSTISQDEGVIINKHQQTFMAYEYTRMVIETGVDYTLVIEVCPVASLPQGTLELLLLSRHPGLLAEPIQQVEPVKYIQKYIPNKYGLIFKQRLFCNSETNFTLAAKLVEGEQSQVAGDKKAAKKSGKEQQTVQIVEKPFHARRNFILRILEGQTVLYESRGINKINIANFLLHTGKGSHKQYYIEMKFDLRAWPEAQLKSQDTEKIYWALQIYSEETIALVRDTRQEDKDKLTRKSWEDAEPGRAECAKKARRRFLIDMKKQAGEKLTEQQELIHKAPRLTKKQQLEQERLAEQKKNVKGKKDEKKVAKDAKEVKKQEVAQKPQQKQPRSTDNFMTEIKQFLQMLQNCHIRKEKLKEGEEPKIRPVEQLETMKENARMAEEDRVGKLIRSIERRETVKIRSKERKEELSIFFNEVKHQLKEAIAKYFQWRVQDQEKDRARQDKERTIIDVVKADKPNITEDDLKKTIAEYIQIPGHNQQLALVAQMVAKNIKINVLTDKISGLLAGWDIQELKNVRQEIHREHIEGIDHDIEKQMKQMLQEAEKNPNFVVQKQAEAKKAKKGGKK